MRPPALTSLIVIAVCTALAQGTVYNLTPADAWRTTLSNLLPGDSVFLASGDYDVNGFITFTLNGLEGSPITIQNQAGATPRFVQSQAQNILNLEGSNYILRNFSVGNSPAASRGIVLLSS